MADTMPRIHVTSAAWSTIVAGAITTGTISPESQPIRVAITTGAAPSDLEQGHVLNPNKGWGFILDTGETLYAIADNTNTSLIVTY